MPRRSRPSRRRRATRRCGERAGRRALRAGPGRACRAPSTSLDRRRSSCSSSRRSCSRRWSPIRLDSRGPAIYRQRRVGRGEREFELLKLRTMAPGSDPVGVGTAVGGGDPRVTRVGAVLRRTSLDELPNLVNVLRGEMALVGPRPTIPAHLDLLRPPPAPPPRRPPGDDRLGAGQRPGRDHLGRADRARQLVRREPLARASTCGSSPAPSSRSSAARASTRAEARPPARFRPMTSERGSEVEVRIRPFRPEDLAAVHRWFNNREAISSLMEVRAVVQPRRTRRAGRTPRSRRRRRRGPQVGDRGRGARRAGRLHRSLRAVPPDRPRARRADRRPPGRPRRRPRGRAADGREGVRGVRRPPRLRADPGLQRARQEGRHLAGLAARGDDARAHPPPRRDADRLRDLGDHARRLARALARGRGVSAIAAVELIEDRGAAAVEDEFFRSREFLAAEGVTHTLRRRRRRLDARRCRSRPRDPRHRPRRRDLARTPIPGARVSGGPIDPATVDLAGAGLVSALRPRPPRRAARASPAATDRSVVLVSDPAEPRKSRMSDRQQIRKNEAAGYEVARVAGPGGDRRGPRRASSPSTPRRCASSTRPSTTSSTPTTSRRCSPRR